MREDVHRLGELVGELVHEQAGEALFDLVESARRAAISRREGDDSAHAQLQDLLSALAPNSARDFIRAFSTYFQMVNMAEKVHRIRRRRQYLADPDMRQPFGFRATFERLKAQGCALETLEQAIGRIQIEPVFSAHPSEVTRRTLLRKQQNIARHLISLLDAHMTPEEIDATFGQIRVEMTTGWQTADRPAERRLSDEAEHVLFFITEVLYRMIPPFYESLERAMQTTYASENRRVRTTEFVHLATSIGGDMDGNPTVTAKSIRDALARQRSLILDLYYRECRALNGQLSQSEDRCSFSPAIAERIALYRGHFPTAAYSVPLRHGRMPYRMLLRLMQARLQATFDDAAFPYESPEEFIADIELIADSLTANLGRNAGLFSVRRLLRRVRTFKFHIATLDLRQNASAHRHVIGPALGEQQWSQRTSAERTARIEQAIMRRESPAGALSSDARRMLSVFHTIAHSRRRYGNRSIGLYVVSAADGPDDVLAVLLLAKWSQLGPKGGAVPLDIAPLFETSAELARAAAIMEGLLGDEVYREHLAGRGYRQFVALGYAVGNRHGDVISARWSLNKVQIELAQTARRFGVELVFVHARGGSFSRAGGPMHEAIRALPGAAVSSYLRVTEEGETINTRYGLRGLAMRSFEQLVTALVWETSRPGPPRRSEQRWHDAMAFMAEASGTAFEGLVFADGFADYFRLATPIDVIERMGIGTGAESAASSPVEGVHEAAWTLAWVQCRCLLPAWYGFAAGIRAAQARYGEDLLKSMLAEWPLFRLLVADVEFALGKADLLVAERYSMLAGDAHARYFPLIHEAYLETCKTLLGLTGEAQLLAQSETMARSIQLRNPYVDPMSFLQVNLLERWRGSGRKPDAVFQALVASVNGIAYAMQDAG